MSVEAVDRNTILAPGDMLGCYRIESFLGRGGFGVTYLALDTKLQLKVAVKEYLPEQIAERTLDNAVQPKRTSETATFSWGLSRFIKEAQTLAKFKHRSIVRVMAVFELNGTAYMVMEYERGNELKQLIRTQEFCSEDNLKRIIDPIIDGLAEVHRHGYIHRDIKPANILIRNDGTPVLLDFGSARLATGARTQSLTALVSVGYAPLEQYNDTNDSQQGPWTDVYALGAVLYFAITGHVPVDSTLRGSAVVNDQLDPMKPLELIAPEGFSESFCRAIDWALCFRIKDRPQTLDQWRSKLLNNSDANSDETVLMPRVSTRALAQHRVSPDQQTARNQVIDTDRSAQPATTDHRAQNVDSAITPQSLPLAVEQAEYAGEPFPAAHEWETTGEREQRESDSRSPKARAIAKSKSKSSKTPLITGFSFLALTVLAVSFKTLWLPPLQGLLATSSNLLSVERDSSGQTITAQALAGAQGVDSAVDDAGEDNTQVGLQIEGPQLNREPQVVQIERTKAIAQLDAENTRRDEKAAAEVAKQEREAAEKARQDNQAIAEKARQEKEAVAEATRLSELRAEEKAKQQAEKAAAEKAARDKAAVAQVKLEAQQVADREAKLSAIEAAAHASRNTQGEPQLAAEKATREQAINQQRSEQVNQKTTNTESAQTQLLDESAQMASLSARRVPVESLPDVTRPITDSDIGNVLQQFNSLRQAIARKDESTLNTLTLPSERKNSYFNYLFRTFDSIEISLGGVHVSPGEQIIRATLQIARMKRNNGDVVFPPSEFKNIPIHSIRLNEWSKIHW